MANKEKSSALRTRHSVCSKV